MTEKLLEKCDISIHVSKNQGNKIAFQFGQQEPDCTVIVKMFNGFHKGNASSLDVFAFRMPIISMMPCRIALTSL